MKDRCINCGHETAYDVNTHVDMRSNYVEGAGQLCVNCAALDDMFLKSPNTDHLKHIMVSVHTIISTSNDQELGAKVRRLYYETI